MIRQSIVRALLPLFFASVALCQTAPATNEAPFRVYAFLKPSVMQQPAARDGLLRRLGALGAANLQYNAGVDAIRCDVPLLSLAALRNDPDVTGVLPADSARDPLPLAVPSSPAPTTPVPPPAAFGPLNAPPMTTMGGMGGVQPTFPAPAQPPMLGTMGQPQLTFPQPAASASGLLAELAVGLVGRLLTRQPSCQVDIGAAPAAVPNAGGLGSFSVRASGNCAWQAISTADWVEITNGTGGSGATVVVYKVAAGSPAPRTGNIHIQATTGSSPLKGRTVQTVSQQ